MAMLRRTFSSSSSSSSSFFQKPANTNLSNVVIHLLTLLSLSLAAYAFILQWRGGLHDPFARFSPGDREFPGSGFFRPAVSSAPFSRVEGILGKSQKLTFPYFRDWRIKVGSSSSDDHLPKICITTSTSAGLEQTLPWIFYHKVIGISTFFMFVDGEAAASPTVSKVLKSIPGVTLINRTRELVEEQGKSRIWNETWARKIFYKPCNYELYVKQTLNMEMGIVLAREAGMDWIFHLDTDELIHPAGTREYSVQELLLEVPPEIDTVIFTNYESGVESDNIKEPFSEVSLFKKNPEHLIKKMYQEYYEEATRGTANYFLTYSNGKSGARVKEHLRPHGAHRWSNYLTPPKEVQFHEAAVLHYSYSKFSDLTSRRNRCNCKPNKKDLNRCFMLQFDRDAFIMASNSTEEEMRHWYNENVVWNNNEVKHKLLKAGIITRIYSPMVIIKQLKESGVFSSVIANAGGLD